MIIHRLSSTYSSHGAFTSRLQICASICSPMSVNRPSTTIRSSTGLKDHPTMIDGAAFLARSNTSAPCKVHSIPIHPPH